MDTSSNLELIANIATKFATISSQLGSIKASFASSSKIDKEKIKNELDEVNKYAEELKTQMYQLQHENLELHIKLSKQEGTLIDRQQQYDGKLEELKEEKREMEKELTKYKDWKQTCYEYPEATLPRGAVVRKSNTSETYYCPVCFSNRDIIPLQIDIENNEILHCPKCNTTYGNRYVKKLRAGTF